MPKSRSRSKTRKIPTNSRGAHSDRASSAQSDPAAKNHSDSSYTSSDHSPRIQSRHASNHHTDRESHRNSENVSKPVSIDKLNATQIESTGLHFNSSYLFTFSGIIQCTCLILEVIGFVCVHLSKYSDMALATLYSIRVWVNFSISSLFLCLRLWNVYVKYTNIPWIPIEWHFYRMAAVVSLLTSALITARHDGLFTIAAIFGYVAMFGYVLNVWLSYRKKKNPELLDPTWYVNSPRTSTEC